MKNKIEKVLLTGLCIVALVLSTGAFAITFRQSNLHHLRVAPGSNAARLVNTNVSEFVDQTGTNAFAILTNVYRLGATNVGPRLAVRQGTSVWHAVSYREIVSTNSAGKLSTNIFRNGLLTERFVEGNPTD